jgi:aspartate aminotransferase
VATLRPELKDRTITISGASKSYAMTGWRMGWTVAPAAVVKAMDTIQSQETSCPSSVSQAALIAALDGPQDWLDEVAAGYRADRDAAFSVVADDHILRARLPAAGPFLFLHLGELHIENLLAAGVALVDGAAFGAPGYARLPFGGAAELRDELHRRLALATS